MNIARDHEIMANRQDKNIKVSKYVTDAACKKPLRAKLFINM